MVKELLLAAMREKRALYLEEHPPRPTVAKTVTS